jgi:uncharacterized protein (TIGR00369 family)
VVTEKLDMSPAELERFLAQAFPDLDTSHFEVEAVRPDGLDVRLRVRAVHLRPGGTVSGPALMTLADTATYLALVARRGVAATPALTTSLTMQFLRRPPAGDLRARTTLLRVGSRLAVAEVIVVPAEGGGDAVAHATVSYFLPAPR